MWEAPPEGTAYISGGKNYIDNGHGGNTELSKLVEQQEKRT